MEVEGKTLSPSGPRPRPPPLPFDGERSSMSLTAGIPMASLTAGGRVLSAELINHGQFKFHEYIRTQNSCRCWNHCKVQAKPMTQEISWIS